jgi:hypothetical protein
MEHNLWQHPRLEKKGVNVSLRGTLRRLSALYRRLAVKKPDLARARKRARDTPNVAS